MKTSQELLKKAGILPRLHLGTKTEKGVKPMGAKRVKLIEDKIIKKVDARTAKEIEYVRYILEEGGEQKYYDTKLRGMDGKLSYLVQRLAEVKEGKEVIMEMKKQGMKNYIEVIPVENTTSIEVDSEDSDDEEVEDSNSDKSDNEPTDEIVRDNGEEVDLEKIPF